MGWLVGAVGIEPATLGSSGSIRVKEKSVQLIGLQVALCNASFGKSCDSPPLRRRLYNNCDTKPVLAAQIDFFDELRLLILIVIHYFRLNNNLLLIDDTNLRRTRFASGPDAES